MPDDVRGMFLLDPPSGGLARLRDGIRAADLKRGSLPLLPWATAASLLVAVLLVMHRGEVGFARQIEEDVLRQEPIPWTQMPGEGDVYLYLARPAE